MSPETIEFYSIDRRPYAVLKLPMALQSHLVILGALRLRISTKRKQRLYKDYSLIKAFQPCINFNKAHELDKQDLRFVF